MLQSFILAEKKFGVWCTLRFPVGLPNFRSSPKKCFSLVQEQNVATCSSIKLLKHLEDLLRRFLADAYWTDDLW